MKGWFIVTYALGIYLLNLLIAFLSPKIDPATLDEDTGDEGMLPSSAGEEFKPFIRRLPEFKFWYVSLSPPHTQVMREHIQRTLHVPVRALPRV